METRNFQLDFETAKQWFGGSVLELKDLAVKTYPELAKKELPKSWWELEKVNGAWVDDNCDVRVLCSSLGLLCEQSSRNIFATKEQAEACVAMAQLSQLMKVYNDGWAATFGDFEEKATIKFDSEVCIILCSYKTRSFLTFKDEPTAELFLQNFRELIEKAKPLL